MTLAGVDLVPEHGHPPRSRLYSNLHSTHYLHSTPTSSVFYNSTLESHAASDPSPPLHRYPSQLYTEQISQHGTSPRPQPISTSTYPVQNIHDDERTPIARYRTSDSFSSESSYPGSEGSGNMAKYECSYCGKGFNRPSSLKIHLNSHTGEKPFICPVESCGRSFSVLSNMRRHARVHTQNSVKGKESDDEIGGNAIGSKPDSSYGVYRQSPTSNLLPTGSSTSRRLNRRSSTASISSNSSRRSRSVSSSINGTHSDHDEPPEKRTRLYPK
ncbi:hypothetical protein BDQ12DRAFT_672961 [Crucibulum laeve]|uniref:C2H2-type domain-containing protein n=1 Tax=Crucibulum laeve TaxID=68775 RepID=A0A5C3MKH8_9AGAR|nr:hypothetical protein BDQ12DRAFT_672961 [Crucibulum laeve]